MKLDTNVHTNGCGVCGQCVRGYDAACTSPLRATGYSFSNSCTYSGVVYGAEYIIADVNQLVLLAPSYHNPFLSERKSRSRLHSPHDYYSSYSRGLADGNLSRSKYADNLNTHTLKSDTVLLTDSNISTIMTSSSCRTSASHHPGSGPRTGDIVNSCEGQIPQHLPLRSVLAPALKKASNLLDGPSDTTTISRDWRLAKRLKTASPALANQNRELSPDFRISSYPRQNSLQ